MPVSFSDFQKMDMRVGRIDEIERVPDTDKLYRMQVDVGEETIQIVSSLVDFYEMEELEGKKITVLVNLEPAEFAGAKSEGMLLCAETDDESEVVVLNPDEEMEPGTKIT